MSRLFRLTILILGICLILMALIIIAFPQEDMGVSELWAVVEPYNHNTPGIYIQNQQTGRTINMVHGPAGEIVGWSNDGRTVIYTDSNICGEGGCFPDGSLYAASLTSGEPRLLGELRLENRPVNRSHTGRWYAQINGYNELILIREDGLERRFLTQLPSKLDEIWYSYWSPDDEWLYVAFGLSYQSRLRQSPLIMIFRTRPDDGVLQPVANFDGIVGHSFHVGDDWLLLLGNDSETDSNLLIRMRPDGSERSDGVEISGDLVELDYWVASSGSIFGFSRGFFRKPLYQIDVETGQAVPLILGPDGQALPSRDQLELSPSRRYLAGLFADDSSERFREEGDWVVMDGSGDILLQHPIQWCERLGTFWVNESAYVGESLNDEKCRLLQYRPGDETPTIAQEFPTGSEDFRVVSTNNGTWISYSLNGTGYITTLDGRETTEIKLNENAGIQGWVTISAPEADKHPAILIGIGLIALAGLSARYKIVRR